MWNAYDETKEDVEETENQKHEDLKEMEKDYDRSYPKISMGNYGKKSVQKQKYRSITNIGTQSLSLLYKDGGGGADEKEELFPAISSDGGWQWIKGVVDSGASESVAPPAMCPQYPVRPSAGSIAGHEYDFESDAEQNESTSRMKRHSNSKYVERV